MIKFRRKPTFLTAEKLHFYTTIYIFSNTHDGSGSVKVAITPIRVVCNNTLNLALSTAKRSFSMIHTGDIKEKMKPIEELI